jgi:GLPGLI family protein
MPKDIYTTTNIDSANIRIWYALNAIDINKPETYDDWQRLEIGTNHSKYYSFFVFSNDSLVTEWIKKHPNNFQSSPLKLGEMGKKNNWNEYYYSEYFKDLSKNILTQYIRMPNSALKDCQYKEDIPVQNWKISSDTLTVAGYLCQKATCTFRGRNFIAWFSVDIPIQNGPWKFGGLPGLILKVYDDDRLYNFECTKIENLRKKYPVKIYDYKNYIKTDRLKLNKLLKRMYDDYYNVAGFVATNQDGMPVEWKKIPYNPLELE